MSACTCDQTSRAYDDPESTPDQDCPVHGDPAITGAQPSPTIDEYTPTDEDLREIADFLRRRSLDEAGASGMMSFFQGAGVTVSVNIPKGTFTEASVSTERAKYQAWMDEHSPDRFTNMAHQLAGLADALADATSTAANANSYAPVRDYHMNRAWRAMTSAARLWRQHADFNPLWAKDEEKN